MIVYLTIRVSNNAENRWTSDLLPQSKKNFVLVHDYTYRHVFHCSLGGCTLIISGKLESGATFGMQQLSIHKHLRSHTFIWQLVPSRGQILQRRWGKIAKGSARICKGLRNLLLLLLLRCWWRLHGSAKKEIWIEYWFSSSFFFHYNCFLVFFFNEAVWTFFHNRRRTSANAIKIRRAEVDQRFLWWSRRLEALAKGFVAVDRGFGLSRSRNGDVGADTMSPSLRFSFLTCISFQLEFPYCVNASR